jgi:branched-chain amino acid transport system substrate-binding protein
MTRLRVGACLSLTGRYGRFGRQAANGLLAWKQLAGDSVEVEIEDDASDPATLAAIFPRVANRADLLLGPYSTQLMRVAGELAPGLDALLWNQGGSGDDVQAMRPGWVVSALAPTSRYAVPFVETLAEQRPAVELWVMRGRGKFGRQVAAGAVAAAEHRGVATREVRVGGDTEPDEVPDRWALFSAGRFEDDIAIVKAAQGASPPPETIGSVAAGVHDFASEVDDIDGIYGIAADRGSLPVRVPHRRERDPRLSGCPSGGRRSACSALRKSRREPKSPSAMGRRDQPRDDHVGWPLQGGLDDGVASHADAGACAMAPHVAAFR